MEQCTWACLRGTGPAETQGPNVGAPRPRPRTGLSRHPQHHLESHNKGVTTECGRPGAGPGKQDPEHRGRAAADTVATKTAMVPPEGVQRCSRKGAVWGVRDADKPAVNKQGGGSRAGEAAPSSPWGAGLLFGARLSGRCECSCLNKKVRWSNQEHAVCFLHHCGRFKT